MDSGNSGSFQSSSGGAVTADIEEYDSRTTTTTQSTSSFLLNPSINFNNHLLQPPSTNTTFFNPNPFQDHPGSLWTAPVHPNRSNQTNFNNTVNTYPINPNPRNANTKTGHGSDHNHQLGITVKNPKKRTRASRRAPTTVLTTDTTNFRQMVQEFTGIPTAPFTAAAFSNRFDHFRQTAQKVQQQQQPPFLNSTPASNNITTTSYNLPPSNIHEFQKQPSSLLDLQKSMISFQSLLQTTLSQQSNDLSGYPTSSDKRWRDENEMLNDFEGVVGNSQKIGGSKLNSGLENVGGSDQVQGNEGSWICTSKF